MNSHRTPILRPVWPTLPVKIAEKLNRHFQASWASQSMGRLLLAVSALNQRRKPIGGWTNGNPDSADVAHAQWTKIEQNEANKTSSRLSDIFVVFYVHMQIKYIKIGWTACDRQHLPHFIGNQDRHDDTDVKFRKCWLVETFANLGTTGTEVLTKGSRELINSITLRPCPRS